MKLDKFLRGLIVLFTLLVIRLSAEVSTSSETLDSDVGDVLQIVTLSEQPWYEAEDRAVAREIASPRNSKLKSMSIADIKIPAGVEVVPHHHIMEEVYYIVSGEGTMMVEDEEAIVKAGQSVIIAPHQWHNIRNHTDEELRLIVTCVPAWAPELLEFDRSTIPTEE
jgi:mannose-6-phosphate isomerase-like protein (cupin superfamily)